jgi:signal transduction histidine kinase
MTLDFVPCPRCGKQVDPQTRTCEYCGVSLALAALLAERDLTEIPFIEENIPISPEILVPRVGEYLIEKGVLKPEDLKKALDFQEKLGEAGQTRLIGQALLDLGFVSKETLDQVITEQIIQLQFALQQANAELEDRVRERTVELENALSRLAELNQLKSNFIANVSHELRTPLTHIKGYLELLVEQELGPLTNEQANALGVMGKSEERLEQLIEDLIQFSLVARGQLNLEMHPVNLQEVVAEVVQDATQYCKKAHLTLITDIPQEIPKAMADHQKVLWVLTHFIDNAIKFTPEGGLIQIKVKIGGKRVEFSVVDSGIGIGPERIEEIFLPFHQLDSSATRRYGGTGLGLAMARQIIEAHGSTIKVKSKLGSGSSFEFSLPIFPQIIEKIPGR